MGLRDFFTRSLQTKPKTESPKASPITIAYDEENYNPFTLRNRDENILKSYDTIYQQGGLVAEAIDVYVNFILSTGYTLQSESDELRDKVDEVLDDIDITRCLKVACTDALKFGDGFLELIPNKKGELVDLLPRDSIKFDIITDEKGRVKEYRQIVRKGIGGVERKVITVPKERMVKITLMEQSGTKYGVSLIGRALDSIKRDDIIAESITRAIKRHGFRKYKVIVGNDENLPDPDVLKYVGRNFEDIDSKHEFVIPPTINIEEVDKSPLGGVEEFSRFSIERVCASMGMPEEFLGLGRGSTEATANVRLRAYFEKISSMQLQLARQINTQIIDRIVPGNEGAVHIQFNDPNPQDEKTKVEWINILLKANPYDPESIVTFEWVREQLGIEIDESEFEDDTEDETPGSFDETNYPAPPGTKFDEETEERPPTAGKAGKEDRK